MSNTKHTPTPWAMQETPSGKAKVVDDKGFSIVNTTAGAYAEQRANAAFIVRAVNSHEQLVDVVKEMMQLGDRLVDDIYGYEFVQKAKAVLAAAGT